MKTLMLLAIGSIIGVMTVYFNSIPSIKEKAFEAGKKFARDSILNANDSLLYTGIPDTISYKPELSNGGSYKIKGK